MGRKSKDIELNKINVSPTGSFTNAKDIANELNMHFTEVGPKLASNIPSTTTTKSFEDYITKSESVFSFVSVPPTLVHKLLEHCDIKKAVGVDKISNKILQIGSSYICESLTDMFNLAIQSSSIPTD